MTPVNEQNDYYGENAYRSDNIPHMPDQAYAYNKLGYKRMPWGVNKDILPPALNRGFELLLEDEKIRLNSHGEEIPRDKWGEYNHEYLEDANVAFSSKILGYAYAVGRYMAIPASIVVMLSLVLGLWGLDLTNDDIHQIIITLFLFPGIFFYMWAGFRYLYYKKPELFSKKGKGRTWQLNRRTGMVTQWIYPSMPDDELKIEQYPFTHLDAYILKMMTQGGMLYYLLLHNRYTDQVLKLKDFIGATSESGVASYWSFIQNYMDVSKPLPEFVMLEPYRHLDPVTAEHDKKVRRNPTRFRELTKEQWKIFNELFPPVWEYYQYKPCIFQEEGYVKYLLQDLWYPDPIPQNSNDPSE